MPLSRRAIIAGVVAAPFAPLAFDSPVRQASLYLKAQSDFIDEAFRRSRAYKGKKACWASIKDACDRFPLGDRSISGQLNFISANAHHLSNTHVPERMRLMALAIQAQDYANTFADRT